ncbi:MAG: HEAT repeat domain-containing protein [Candidatus Aminicenantes bacterium]|nr:HEAT repeat domain-containing protein [Candidatus Aminicenantes bacterium]
MIDTLPENSKVHIIEKEKDWVLVDDNTKKGWIHKKNLEKDFVFFRKKSNLPEDRIERLTVLVHDVNFEVKMMAAQALAETADRRAWDVLTGALEDINPETRYAALCALGSRNNQQWVTPIIKMLKKEIALNVLTCGIRILGDLGDKRATKLLIGFLSHEDATVRWDAASSLGKTGDPLAVKALIVTLKDDNNTVVSNAADALGKIKDSSAVEPLIYLLKRKELQLREQALLALKNITKLDFGLDFNKWLEWWKGKSNFTYRRVFDNC